MGSRWRAFPATGSTSGGREVLHPLPGRCGCRLVALRGAISGRREKERNSDRDRSWDILGRYFGRQRAVEGRLGLGAGARAEDELLNQFAGRCFVRGSRPEGQRQATTRGAFALDPGARETLVTCIEGSRFAGGSERKRLCAVTDEARRQAWDRKMLREALGWPPPRPARTAGRCDRERDEAGSPRALTWGLSHPLTAFR